MSIARFCAEFSALLAIFVVVYVWSVVGYALQA